MKRFKWTLDTMSLWILSVNCHIFEGSGNCCAVWWKKNWNKEIVQFHKHLGHTCIRNICIELNLNRLKKTSWLSLGKEILVDVGFKESPCQVLASSDSVTGGQSSSVFRTHHVHQRHQERRTVRDRPRQAGIPGFVYHWPNFRGKSKMAGTDWLSQSESFRGSDNGKHCLRRFTTLA